MRISRHQMFMEMARVVARRSTCPRLNVGAILVTPDLETFTGYNGAPPGEAHCTDVGCMMEKGSCIRTIHAEINAIKRARNARARDLTLYVTNSPCLPCTDEIVKFGHIHTVYFENEYRSIAHLVELHDHGITVLRLVPNGCIMNLAGERVDT